jgi:hypothetical protein
MEKERERIEEERFMEGEIETCKRIVMNLSQGDEMLLRDRETSVMGVVEEWGILWQELMADEGGWLHIWCAADGGRRGGGESWIRRRSPSDAQDEEARGEVKRQRWWMGEVMEDILSPIRVHRRTRRPQGRRKKERKKKKKEAGHTTERRTTTKNRRSDEQTPTHIYDEENKPTEREWFQTWERKYGEKKKIEVGWTEERYPWPTDLSTLCQGTKATVDRWWRWCIKQPTHNQYQSHPHIQMKRIRGMDDQRTQTTSATTPNSPVGAKWAVNWVTGGWCWCRCDDWNWGGWNLCDDGEREGRLDRLLSCCGTCYSKGELGLMMTTGIKSRFDVRWQLTTAVTMEMTLRTEERRERWYGAGGRARDSALDGERRRRESAPDIRLRSRFSRKGMAPPHRFSHRVNPVEEDPSDELAMAHLLIRS